MMKLKHLLIANVRCTHLSNYKMVSLLSSVLNSTNEILSSIFLKCLTIRFATLRDQVLFLVENLCGLVMHLVHKNFVMPLQCVSMSACQHTFYSFFIMLIAIALFIPSFSSFFGYLCFTWRLHMSFFELACVQERFKPIPVLIYIYKCTQYI